MNLFHPRANIRFFFLIASIATLSIFLTSSTQVPQPPSLSTGTIQGIIHYEGGVVQQVKNVIKDEHTCGAHDIMDQSLITSEESGLRWAVVSISDPIEGNHDMSQLPGPHTIDQSSCVFEPHIVLVGVNEPLYIVNEDHTLHNVRTVSFLNDIFNKVQIYIPGAPAPRDSVRFSDPEVIEMVCDVHGWMRSYIHVVDHPFYSISDQEGHFSLTNVPEGTHTLHFWHEKLGEMEKNVKVKAGQVSELDISYKAKG